MNAVEKIYYNMDKLSDNYVDLAESIEASDKVTSAIKSLVPEDKQLKFSDEVSHSQAAYEKQGFIYGFNFAVSLLTSGKVVAANE